MAHRHYLLILLGLFMLLAIPLGIAPLYRHDWMLENVLTVLAVVLLLSTSKFFPLSRVSYTLIFVFLCLHETGSHYTYAEVPYDRWWQSAFGYSLNEALGFQRNNFDRLVHFLYGLLLAYPVREMFIRVADVKGFWSYFLPLDLTMSTSMLYELVEWGAAEMFGGDLGIAYLGIQGDVWDAHKDMALASVGALLAMLITAGLNGWLQRDFAREWNDSLRIKHAEPLGEDELRRMLEQQVD
jgi:putative membrane protein